MLNYMYYKVKISKLNTPSKATTTTLFSSYKVLALEWEFRALALTYRLLRCKLVRHYRFMKSHLHVYDMCVQGHMNHIYMYIICFCVISRSP